MTLGGLRKEIQKIESILEALTLSVHKNASSRELADVESRMDSLCKDLMNKRLLYSRAVNNASVGQSSLNDILSLLDSKNRELDLYRRLMKRVNDRRYVQDRLSSLIEECYSLESIVDKTLWDTELDFVEEKT